MDGKVTPSAPLPIALHLFGAIMEAYHVTKALLVHTADTKEPALIDSAQQRIKNIAALKRRANATGVTWALATS